MATSKKSSKQFKANKKNSPNKLVILVGVALITIVGVVVARYSGASGEVWSIRSQRVGYNGGTVRIKDNGSAYWIGGTNNSVYMFVPSTGLYCVVGSYQADNSKRTVFVSGSGNTAKGTGNKGQKFDTCFRVLAGQQLSLTVNSGTIVFNRFEKR